MATSLNQFALPSRNIMGVDITVANAAEATQFLDAQFLSGKSTSVAFANANFLNCTKGEDNLKKSLGRFLILNDGLGVDLASWIIHGETFPANLNGTDFVPHYLKETSNCFRIFVLGGLPGVAEASLRNLAKTFPQHDFVGCYHGYLLQNSDIASQIKRSKADVLLVGMGNPKQEEWLSQYFDSTGCKLGFAIGAFIDFSSGRVARAPAFVRKFRIEWLFRFFLEPNRLFKRYTIDVISFMTSAMLERWRGNIGGVKEIEFR